MLIVGLTGGIATGKSTVAGMLDVAGAYIVDADKMARKAVEPGKPAYHEICRQFGDNILQPDGNIDRILLGNIVFGNENLRRHLEAIVHPWVKTYMENDIQAIIEKFPQAVVVKDIPLLLEGGGDEALSEIIVVYVPEAVQVERLMRRNALTREQALLRIQSQMPIEAKKKLATILIDNSGDLETTRQRTMAVYERLARLAMATNI